MGLKKIIIRGARQHNLKNISLEIPRNSLTVITGLSGSGKSSLAFDTLYAEGQRRYVESLSAYARQFLDQMERPEVDSIEGLSPSIAIEQKTTTRSPRSTVGTITEIYDYLRVVYSAIGTPHCPKCGQPIARQSTEQIVQAVTALKPEDRIMVLAPVVRGRKGEYKKELEKYAKAGYVRARVDGELVNLDEPIALDRRKNHTIEVVVDRLLLKNGIAHRLEQSIEAALKLTGGLVTIAVVGGEEHVYSEKLACPDCGISVPQLEPRSFSFNSPYGACPECHGLGSKYDFDPAKVIADWTKPLFEGGLGPGASSKYLRRTLQIAAAAYGFDLNMPFDQMSRKVQNLVLHGNPSISGAVKGLNFKGILADLESNLADSNSDTYREWLTQYMSPVPCAACSELRLRPESLAVKIAGLSIADFTSLALSEARPAVDRIRGQLTPRQAKIAGRPLAEIAERIDFLLAVGLGYLTLARSAATLSGGEAQRIRLATQIGSRLRGVLYVLDEPSIGLHARDNDRLLSTLETLRDLGNTVLVVEHDEETIRRANYVVDLGPGAGKAGGYLVGAGTPEDIAGNPASLTGQYLSGAVTIPVPTERRSPNGKSLVVLGADGHNLKNIDVTFPLGLLTVITGVSGSGKSTLVNDILYRALAAKLYRSTEKPESHRAISGIDQIDKVVQIDQAPIGRTPRSNPATYTGVFAPIREIYSMLPESRERGYKPGRFSFNVKGGRCEACQGDGQRRIEMNFLPDVYVTCEVCRGKRYNAETLAVRYKGYSISDLLDLPIEEALKVLENIPAIQQKLKTLVDVGLGYIQLGQSATTLSGGEAQRTKLAKELSRRQTGRTLYILDEPTTGLHFDDVKKLLSVLNSLVALGNTVLIIEHNLDVMKQADWIIDLGPEGGEGGGRVIAQGSPEQVARNKKSYTGQILARALNPASQHVKRTPRKLTSAAPTMSDERPLTPEPSETPESQIPTGGALAEGGPPKPQIQAGPQRYLPEDLRVPWRWFDLLIFVLVCFALGVFLIVVAAGVFFVLSRNQPGVAQSLSENLSLNILFMVALDLAVVGCLAAQIRLQFRAPFWRTIGWRAVRMEGVPQGIVFLGLVFTGLLLDVGVAIVSSISPPTKDLPIDQLFKDPRAALLFMLVAVLLAPAVEEMIFRGYIYPVIARSWGITSGVIVTGLLFGGLHAQQLWGGPWQIASIVAVGIVLTFVRAKTGSVLASFIVHTSYNSFQVLLILIGTHGLHHMPSIH